MTIAVGSTNPVKINAVRLAVTERYPQAQVQGFSTSSGVAEQPWGDEETQQGSINRATKALNQLLSKNQVRQSEAQVLGLGLEGGVLEWRNEVWSTVWAAVVDDSGGTWTANGARIKVPRVLADKLRTGGEMGPAMAELVGIDNLKHKQGMMGVVTAEFVDRTEEYAGIAKTALGLWYGRNWYKQIKMVDKN